MVHSILYRRPPFVPYSRSSSDTPSKHSSSDDSIQTRGSPPARGIPEALSFDRIISGGVCPPCTTPEFVKYLRYVEHAAENLQFFLWYRDYSARWERLPDNKKILSPVWTKEDATAASKQKYSITIFGSIPFGTSNSDPSSPSSAHLQDKHDSDTDDGASSDATAVAPEVATEQAFESAGLKWMPFTMQPCRDEITRIVTVYVADDSPRQLNLSSRERQGLLRALQKTTHPSAFAAIASTVEQSLRRQAHPNFVRWSISNANRPRVIFARGLGIFCILAAFLADLLITLSQAGRAWRVLPYAIWLIGIATLIAAWKGMCVVLHGLHHRHLRPWELFEDDEEKAQASARGESNSTWVDEPWVARYQSRNIIRKIFDREVWVQEPALRQIQDTIFMQAVLAAVIMSAIVTGIFCALPAGNFF